MSEDPTPPTIEAISRNRERLGPHIRTTPIWRWRGPEIERAVGPDTEVLLKLELWQFTGSFKPRGALTRMLDLERAALERGVVAVSAGNHALATIYAADVCGTSAKLVMPKTANPGRIAACRERGGIIELTEDIASAFARARRIEQDEGRTLIHPFDGPSAVLGTATLGLELCRQVDELDAVVVPIGGGGLCAGVACAVKQLQPKCRVFGVEPEGADSMHRSFAVGRPTGIERVATIADSLGAPYAEAYTFALCRAHVDELVTVDDDALRSAMRLLFREMKLAVEPAGAASTAALVGPLAETLRGRRTALVMCGANTDIDSFHEITAER